MKPRVGRNNDEMALRLMIASEGLRRGWIEVAEEMRLQVERSAVEVQPGHCPHQPEPTMK